MLRKSFSFLVLLGMASIMAGCGEEKEPTPTQKWGPDVQSVREKIFRDGTITRQLNDYRMHAGQYPTTEQGLKALFKRPQGVDPKSWAGPYIENEDEIKDKWGNELHYACPGKTYPDKTDQYDLWSLGPDGQDGTKDDILNHNVR